MKVPILVPNVFDHPFTYESGEFNLKLGDYVKIPFGKSELTGVVWNQFEKEKKKKFIIKNVISKLNIPSLNKNTIDFFNWLPLIFMPGLSGSLSHRYVSKISTFSEPASRKSVYLWQSTQNICR